MSASSYKSSVVDPLSHPALVLYLLSSSHSIFELCISHPRPTLRKPPYQWLLPPLVLNTFHFYPCLPRPDADIHYQPGIYRLVVPHRHPPQEGPQNTCYPSPNSTRNCLRNRQSSGGPESSYAGGPLHNHSRDMQRWRCAFSVELCFSPSQSPISFSNKLSVMTSWELPTFPIPLFNCSFLTDSSPPLLPWALPPAEEVKLLDSKKLIGVALSQSPN
ncbi:myb domain protein 3r-4 [Striga asiatica]|uniref:Myb domain protein 3r-4 n=1 Tax=Striga asiatica TaxID=4170 RepID=A0A5A7P4B0_STRAF|nr:myb domain protein 3r-4 [Striga asiatica]